VSAPADMGVGMARQDEPLSDEEIAEIDRELDELFGSPPGPPPLGSRPLDSILGSRTHVRVVRVLVAAGGTKLSIREIARRAICARGRVVEVLRQLEAVGFLTSSRTLTHVLVRIDERHPLATTVRGLFEREQVEVELERARGPANRPPR
jgi:hypothetical protein